ncbi:MAG: HD domain-containing protein [Peptococcaceae bacterium]|jgi:putative nucleotidyltransferase with HDIG domain|nr:HD domain-containing protein [Peptococcaceae bacterium]
MKLDLLAGSTRFEHSRQVSKISALLAERAGYTPEETAMIEEAALYHDIGKADIPKTILNKPGKLTSEEFDIVKTHTELGYRKIMDATKTLSVAATVCQEHHERPDGNGYSHARWTDIHPYAKLISVGDVFDALYSHRAYKPAWSIPEIRAYFREQSGKQFDPEIVCLLLGALDKILLLYKNRNAHNWQNTHFN